MKFVDHVMVLEQQKKFVLLVTAKNIFMTLFKQILRGNVGCVMDKENGMLHANLVPLSDLKK